MTGQLKLIASRLEKKIKTELENMLANDREKYEDFFKNFGLRSNTVCMRITARIKIC